MRIIRYRLFTAIPKTRIKILGYRITKLIFCQPGEFEGAPSSKNFVSNSELISF